MFMNSNHTDNFLLVLCIGCKMLVPYAIMLRVLNISYFIVLNVL